LVVAPLPAASPDRPGPLSPLRARFARISWQVSQLERMSLAEPLSGAFHSDPLGGSGTAPNRAFVRRGPFPRELELVVRRPPGSLAFRGGGMTAGEVMKGAERAFDRLLLDRWTLLEPEWSRATEGDGPLGHTLPAWAQADGRLPAMEVTVSALCS